MGEIEGLLEHWKFQRYFFKGRVELRHSRKREFDVLEVITHSLKESITFPSEFYRHKDALVNGIKRVYEGSRERTGR